jgi:type VI secretion system protein VasJ
VIGDLVRKLFGVRNPDDLMGERIKLWKEWLTPLPPADVGRDPGYDDAFLQIRDEVARLSDNDDALILDACRQILLETGKDLRVAGYYAFARLHRDGSPGFVDGLELVAALIDCFGEALFPVRPEAKKGALDWLAATRTIDLLELGGGFRADDMARAMAALNAIITRTELWTEAARPNLHPLLACFKLEERAPAPPPTANSPPTAVVSGRDLLEQARTMAAYLRAQPDGYGYLPAARLIRCVRWDTLSEPPMTNTTGQSRLPPPRPQLRQQLKRLELQKQWPELLERIESLFTEGASHFWFDLQYFQHVALIQAGSPYDVWSPLLCRDFGMTLHRLPNIEHLQFSDGTPFADETTLEWIARSVMGAADEPEGTRQPAAQQGAAEGDAWPEIEAQARALVESKGLDAAFEWLLGLGTLTSGRQRYRQRQLMAGLADKMGRTDMAYNLLVQLDHQAEDLRLALWEPDIVFDVKHQLARLLRLLLNRKDADKAVLHRQIDKLAGELMVLDPVRALAAGYGGEHRRG